MEEAEDPEKKSCDVKEDLRNWKLNDQLYREKPPDATQGVRGIHQEEIEENRTQLHLGKNLSHP